METLKHEGPGRLGVGRVNDKVFKTPALVNVDFTLSPFNSYFYPKDFGEYDFNLAPSIPLSFYTPRDIIEKALKRLYEVDYSRFNALYLPVVRDLKYINEFLEEVLSRESFDAVYIGNSKIFVKEYRKFVEVIRLIREKDPNLMLIIDLEPFFYPLAVYLGIDAFDTRSLKLYDFHK